MDNVDSAHDESVDSKSRFQMLSFIMTSSYFSIIKLREHGRQLTKQTYQLLPILLQSLSMEGKKINGKYVKGNEN